MNGIELRERFGIDALHATDRGRPEPGPGEVVVRLRAASLNYRDLLVVRGEYDPKLRLPLVPCSDGAGEVVAIGDGVTRVAIGDRVAPIFAQGWLSGPPRRDGVRATLGGPLDGTLVAWRALPAESVVRVPDHLTDEEAATLPCAGVTAWSALVTQGELRPGETVVIQGTGGVALFALGFTRLCGARAIVLSSSDAKLDRARELGAWGTIRYDRTPEWAREVKKLTEGEGADHVVDVGGAGTLAQSIHAVRLGGTISQIGMLGGGRVTLDVIPLHMRQVRIQGVLVGHRESFEAMSRAIALHRYRPVVDRAFPLADTRAAFEHLASGGHFGKVVIRVDGGPDD